MEQQEHRREDVAGYLLSQLRTGSDQLEHVELIQQQWVGSELYEIWDCHTISEGRWWVVTPMTDLYSQDEFKSADYTLTFHIGLTHRVLARAGRLPEDQVRVDLLEGLFRQLEQASEVADQVVEVREAQAAGVALREVLIALAAALVELDQGIADGNNLPKRGDFVGWADRAADYLAPGARMRRHRSYLKALAKETWQYVNWLTHDKHGSQGEAIAGAQIVQDVVAAYTRAATLHRKGRPTECPRCHSRRISIDRTYLDTGIETAEVCEVCDWRSDPTVSPHPTQSVSVEQDAAGSEGPCVTGNEGPGR